MLILALSLLAASAPQSVEVTGQRGMLIEPYPQAYKALKTVLDHSRGDARLAFQLQPHQPGVRVDDVRMRLVWEGGSEAVPVDADGRFLLEPNDAAAAGDGHFVLNKRDEELALSITIAPTRNAVTVGAARRAVAHGQAAWKELLPWYLRIVMPSPVGVQFCAASATPFLVGEQTLVPEPRKRAPVKTPYCAGFETRGPWSDDERIEAPPGATMHYLWNLSPEIY